MTAALTLGGLREVPVDPDAPEAREWLITELSKPEYQAAKPTWFDLLAGAIRDWFGSLQFGSADGPPGAGLLIVVILVAVVIAIAFLVFGLPRINRRSRVTGTLFGDEDDRNALSMRRAAEQAAARGNFALAIAEMFRSIARGLVERTALTVSPGTTAREFGTRAGVAFPALARELASAAAAFDDVRYLGRVGTAAQYAAMASLEAQLRSSRAVLEPVGR